MDIDPAILKNWQFYPRTIWAFAGPALVLAAAVWAILEVVDSGVLWPLWIVVAAGIVLKDIFSERAATFRQGLEIERLKEKIEEYDIIVNAEEE